MNHINHRMNYRIHSMNLNWKRHCRQSGTCSVVLAFTALPMQPPFATMCEANGAVRGKNGARTLLDWKKLRTFALKMGNEASRRSLSCEKMVAS